MRGYATRNILRFASNDQIVFCSGHLLDVAEVVFILCYPKTCAGNFINSFIEISRVGDSSCHFDRSIHLSFYVRSRMS